MGFLENTLGDSPIVAAGELFFWHIAVGKDNIRAKSGNLFEVRL